MKLILHIGQSKTGTTALQNFLFSNKSKFIEKGILYPDYYQNNLPLYSRDHNSVAESLSNFIRYPNFTAEEYFDQFQNELKSNNCDTIILSGESFFGAPQIWRFNNEEEFFDAHKNKIQRLKNITHNHECHVIAYMRPPVDWFETTVAHTIRYEGLLGQKVYENDEQLFELLKPHINYPKLLGYWKDILKPKTMKILPYENGKIEGKDVIETFLKETGLDQYNINFNYKSSEIHKSLDRRYIAVKKELNKSKKTKTQERVTIECLDRLNANLSEILPYEVSAQLKQNIIDYSIPCHKWMTEHYSTNGKDFFELQTLSLSTHKHLTEEETAKALKDYKILYHSIPMQIYKIEMTLKYILRNYYPNLYAFSKKLIGR